VDFRFHNIEMLNLLWILPLLTGLFFYSRYKRKQSAHAFSMAPWEEPRYRYPAAVLIIIAVGFISVALARPSWNPQPVDIRQKGRDVVFLVDVSQSMLAEDLPPSRLERAKIELLDTVPRIQGSRTALVAFAGASVIKCPLTWDYSFFQSQVRNLSAGSSPLGGTKLGDAVRKTVNEVFDSEEKRFKDIVLITDGEDQESFPLEAAKLAGEQGIRLIAIGIGDEKQGQRIPLTGEDGKRYFLTYEGREVWSQLDGDTLREMVRQTPGGTYINAGTGGFDLGEIYYKLIAAAEKTEIGGETIMKYQEGFQLFLLIAFILLIISFALGQGGRNP